MRYCIIILLWQTPEKHTGVKAGQGPLSPAPQMHPWAAWHVSASILPRQDVLLILGMHLHVPISTSQVSPIMLVPAAVGQVSSGTVVQLAEI